MALLQHDSSCGSNSQAFTERATRVPMESMLMDRSPHNKETTPLVILPATGFSADGTPRDTLRDSLWAFSGWAFLLFQYLGTLQSRVGCDREHIQHTHHSLAIWG